MISSTVATLECAAQVRAAPRARCTVTGSPVIASSRHDARSGAFSAGASVSSRMCSASSIRPSPMRHPAEVLDPAARAAAEGDEPDDEQHRRDGGDVERQHLHDERRSDIRPEHDRQRGHQADQRPRPRTRRSSAPVAVLLCSSAVSPSPAAKAAKRLPSAFDSRCRSSEPNARRMPLWTMCRPHSSSATPPIKSRTTIVPIVTHSRPRHRRATLQVHTLPRKRNLRRGCPCRRVDVERLGPVQAAKPQHVPMSAFHPPIDSFSTWRISGRTARILSKTSCTSSAPTKSGFSLVMRS